MPFDAGARVHAGAALIPPGQAGSRPASRRTGWYVMTTSPCWLATSFLVVTTPRPPFLAGRTAVTSTLTSMVSPTNAGWDHTQFHAEERQAGAVDHAGLDQETLGEHEGERSGNQPSPVQTLVLGV